MAKPDRNSIPGNRPKITVKINPTWPDFEFLIGPKKPLLNSREAATAMGRGTGFVIRKIEEGKLEAFIDNSRKKRRPVVTRRSVLSVMADSAQFDPALFDEWIAQFVASLDRDHLAKIIAQAEALLA